MASENRVTLWTFGTAKNMVFNKQTRSADDLKGSVSNEIASVLIKSENGLRIWNIPFHPSKRGHLTAILLHDAGAVV
jgi:hypothetical protein